MKYTKRTISANTLLALVISVTQALAQPVITRQPADQSVSLGASAKFQVSATSTNGPILFQWRFSTTNVPTATNSSLTLTNIQNLNGGDYDAVLTDGSGSVTSRVAHLDVDPTFTKITSGAIVTDLGMSAGCAWGDYNNDGYDDLFVANNQPGAHNFLYRNNGHGTFTKVSTGSIVTDGGNSVGCAWGDFDNDGSLDLFVTNGGLFSARPSFLYHNNGDGDFTKITNAVTESKESFAGIWGDYDNDGLIDLFVGDLGGNKNALFRNNGESTFTKITAGPIPNDGGNSIPSAWEDYNNDGLIDLYVGHGTNLLYRNQSGGTFVKITSVNIVTNAGDTVGCAWGDYDNDGFPDLFVSNGGTGSPQKNLLYHNNGNGTFATITSDNIVNDVGNFVGCAWGDYDNDGFLDLFVCRQLGQNNVLYRNNGDGTFTRVTEGSLVNDAGNSVGCAWGDYDNDGFLDLFVANGAFGNVSQNNFLYRNNGNTNTWFKIKLVGTASNRAAIGAKVRVKATTAGRTVLQLREISSGSGYAGQNTLAHFGLGNATNIDLVRIEWPSGIVQTMTNVAAKQFLTVMEHQEPGVVTAPDFTSVSRSANGAVDLSVTGDTGLLYLFEASTNLVNWTRLGVRTNLTGSIQFTDPRATNFTKRFYRVSVP